MPAGYPKTAVLCAGASVSGAPLLRQQVRPSRLSAAAPPTPAPCGRMALPSAGEAPAPWSTPDNRRRRKANSSYRSAVAMCIRVRSGRTAHRYAGAVQANSGRTGAKPRRLQARDSSPSAAAGSILAGYAATAPTSAGATMPKGAPRRPRARRSGRSAAAGHTPAVSAKTVRPRAGGRTATGKRRHHRTNSS